jgi:hypothetical protein
MKWFNNIISATIETFETAGRARALSTLRRMDQGYLLQFGFSPEKVDRGLDGWPWRVDVDAPVAGLVTALADIEQPAVVTLPSVDEAELQRAA